MSVLSVDLVTDIDPTLENFESAIKEAQEMGIIKFPKGLTILKGIAKEEIATYNHNLQWDTLPERFNSITALQIIYRLFSNFQEIRQAGRLNDLTIFDSDESFYVALSQIPMNLIVGHQSPNYLYALSRYRGRIYLSRD